MGVFTTLGAPLCHQRDLLPVEVDRVGADVFFRQQAAAVERPDGAFAHPLHRGRVAPGGLREVAREMAAALFDDLPYPAQALPGEFLLRQRAEQGDEAVLPAAGLEGLEHPVGQKPVRTVKVVSHILRRRAAQADLRKRLLREGPEAPVHVLHQHRGAAEQRLGIGQQAGVVAVLVGDAVVIPVVFRKPLHLLAQRGVVRAALGKAHIAVAVPVHEPGHHDLSARVHKGAPVRRRERMGPRIGDAARPLCRRCPKGACSGRGRR